MPNRKRNKVVKYSRPFKLNIGFIIFLFVFLYIIFVAVNFLTKEHISIYEVTETKISDDTTVQGIVLRNEEVINTEQAGYLNYYNAEGEKIAKNSIVYSVDGSGQVTDTLSDIDSDSTFNSDNIKKVRANILSFRKSFTKSDYSQVSDFKYDLENVVFELAQATRLDDLNKALAERGQSNTFHVVNAKESGIISYSTDGYESLTEQQITPDLFNNPIVTRKQLRTTEAVANGSPAYKLVKDDIWSIIIPLSEDQYNKLKDKTSLKIKISKDDLTLNTTVSTFQSGGANFAKLVCSSYIEQYINDRFIHIEMILNSANGLKIPNTSILNQTFYTVPDSYFTVGGDSSTKGLIKESYNEKGEVQYTFVPTEIYYDDGQNSYVDMKKFNAGDWIHNQTTNERYQISTSAPLDGVYNVNEGYCVFRRIEKEYENSEYCIIKNDTPNGLAVYDHIVINPNKLKEDDFIK